MRGNKRKAKKTTGKRKVCLYAAAVLLVLIASFIEMSYETFDLQKIAPYMYSVECGKYPYAVAELALENDWLKLSASCCSTIKKGGIAGRNLDWLYDDEAEFVVTTPRTDDRYATLGVASLTGIRDGSIGEYTNLPMLYLLPFFTVDGINENGLFVSVNEVPAGDAGYTTGTNPGAERLCTAIAARYVLDYAADVEEAVALLAQRDLYSCSMDGELYEVHLLIADRDKTVVIEFVDNEMVVVEDACVMTNFYLSLDGYTDHAEGVERYEILTEGYEALDGIESFRTLLSQVWYSGLYDEDTSPAWRSECYGEYVSPDGEEFTIRSDLRDFPGLWEDVRAGFADRQRDGTFWTTTHTSDYDLEELTLSLDIQEGSASARFEIGDNSAAALQEQLQTHSESIMIPLETVCLLVMLVLVYGIFFESGSRDRKSKWFTVIVFTCIVALVSDIAAWAYEGSILFQALFNCAALIMGGLLSIPFVFYEYEYINEREPVSAAPAVVLTVYNIAAALGIVILMICGKIFYFEDGIYYTGDLYWLCIVVNLVNLVYIMVTILYSRRILGRHDATAFSLYVLIPLLATAYELIDSQLELGFVAAGFSALFLYISLQTGRENELRIRQQLLEELCYVDQMTGLKNRRAYEEDLESLPDSSGLGVIFCDVNGLKFTNDHHGHKAGDELIVRLSKLLRESFPEDGIYRISGDEFVVMTLRENPESFDRKAAEFAALLIQNDDCAATGSEYGRAGEVRRLLIKAEQNMYTAKAEYYGRHPERDRRKK